jgi:hypothetical protein
MSAMTFVQSLMAVLVDLQSLGAIVLRERLCTEMIAGSGGLPSTRRTANATDSISLCDKEICTSSSACPTWMLVAGYTNASLGRYQKVYS